MCISPFIGLHDGAAEGQVGQERPLLHVPEETPLQGGTQEHGAGRGKCIDQITLKTPNPECRLYWCLIEFIDWRYSQSC